MIPIRYIYVAGPLTGRDQNVNVRAAVLAAHAIMDAGGYPLVPHLCVLADMIAPRPYADWLAADLAWIERCDAILRLPGESPGADAEVVHARSRGVPVFYDIDDMLTAIRGAKP